MKKFSKKSLGKNPFRQKKKKKKQKNRNQKELSIRKIYTHILTQMHEYVLHNTYICTQAPADYIVTPANRHGKEKATITFNLLMLYENYFLF